MLSAPHVLDPMRGLAARAASWVSVLTRERSVVIGLGIGAAITHALNMFNYPSWVASSQEGSTVYRAWALLQGRELWGDVLSTSPATTLLLAGWLAATGWSQGFGTTFDGARMLMLVLHVGTVPLLYGLARLLGCGVRSALLAAALFALSPLVIAHQRLVVSDNFVAFWALLGMYLLLKTPLPNPPPQGARGLLGLRFLGVGCLGLAFLSYEASGNGAPSAPTLTSFLLTLNDPFLALGAVAALANLARGRRELRALLVGLAGAIPIVRLAVEGSASGAAIESAIPLALNIGLAMQYALDRLPAIAGRAAALVVLVVFVAQYGATADFQSLYVQRPTTAARDALAWTKAHIPPESFVAVEPWAWSALADARSDGVAFAGLLRSAAGPPGADYLLVATDLGAPLVDRGLDAAGRGSRIADIGSGSMPARGALVKRWTSDGAEVALWKTTAIGATEAALMTGGAQYIARRFERAGAFASLDGTVTAHSQANAMLRAVWSGDRAGFARAWRWTKENLAAADSLLASTWRNGTVVSSDSAADADADAALALLLASWRWTDEELLVAGLRMVDSIWRHDVALVGGRPYPTAGNWAATSTIVALNPGAFAPYAYDVFADLDAQHDWRGLIDSGYLMLAAASAPGQGNAQGLPPDGVGLDTTSGELVPLPMAGREAMQFGEDAARSYWRAALHYRWTGDARAEAYLRGAGFLRDEVVRRGAPGRSYTRDGAPVDPYPAGSNNAAAIAALLTIDPPVAHGLYAEHIVGAANRLGAGVYWGELNDLRTQEWSWLAAAFYADQLPQLRERTPPRPGEQTR